jgi:hypothetical protein
MDTQLRLLPSERRRPNWRIDDATREIGRAGVERARAALRQARPVADIDEPGHSHAPAA